ncbi:MAG: glycosyltransferase [Bacteroidota bacterium]
MGHLRDLATVVSPLGRRAIVAVVHHGDFHQLFSSPATRTSALRLVRRLSGIVFNTPGLAERCAPWVPDEKRFVCPNTTSAHTHLSDEAFRARRTERTDGSPIRLLYLSGMIPSKGYLDVLETVGVLCQRGVAVRATFAGRWPNANAEAAFQARTEALGVTSVVEHLGGVSDRYAVRELYLNADAFVLPTTYPTEAHPLTIMESLNAGTPVIATAHASIPEMIEDGRSGLLIPPHAPSALADAVEYLSDLHTWRSFSVAARARYVSHFAPTIVRAWWLALLGQLVTKAP